MTKMRKIRIKLYNDINRKQVLIVEDDNLTKLEFGGKLEEKMTKNGVSVGLDVPLYIVIK